MKRMLPSIFRFLGFYLLGIVACVLVTPVEVTLIGRPVWLFFAPFAAIGYVIFYLSLPQQYVFGSGMLYWIVYAMGLAGGLGGTAAAIFGRGRTRVYAAPVIGFSLGFVGTLGIYYSIAAGI